MSLPKPDPHVRLCEEAKTLLDLLAEVEQVPSGTLAGQMLEDAILGRAHVLKIAARRLRQMGIEGNDGER